MFFNKEQLEKLNILSDSKNILNRIQTQKPNFYPIELKYQQYRTKFSNEYFKGSEIYRGECLYDYLVNHKDDIFNIIKYIDIYL